MNLKLRFFVGSVLNFVSLIFLTAGVFGQNAVAGKRTLDEPIPQKAQILLARGVNLVERQDKVEQGLAQIKSAITLAPNFVKAHGEYVRLKSYWLNQALETQTEYENLMRREPDNPVYPLALAIGQTLAARDARRMWFEQAAKLDSETAWRQYAKARAIEQTNAELALAFSLKAIERNPSEVLFYSAAFPLFIRQKKFAEANELLAKMRLRTDLQTTALRYGWDVRLAQAGATDESKKQLKTDLIKLTESSSDLEILAAIRARFKMLKDEENMKTVEEKIRRLDPTWYAERGEIMFTIDPLKDMRRDYYAGRQNQISSKLEEIKLTADPQEQIRQAESLLAYSPNSLLKKSIYQRILAAAVLSKDAARAIKYGESLLATDSNDAVTLMNLAKVLAGEKRSLSKALQYSARAVELTKDFRPVQRPANVDHNLFNMLMSESRQKETYDNTRAQALNARAIVLSASGDDQQAETLFRQSLALHQTAETYSQLEKTLLKMGRGDEAAKVAAEGEVFWKKQILANFKNEPSKDFELKTIKGERVKLSALKGKTVMINFWATWCVPCVAEMPILIELYNKYKSRGLEILAVSVDAPEDLPKVATFVQKTQINFPVLYDQNAAFLYNVSSYPTTIFIDRQGNFRYRTDGMNPAYVKRDLEFIISELLKDEIT